MITEIVRVRTVDEAGEGILRRAAETIRRGGLVVFPTETVYGLGGDGTNPEAAAKIYAAKGRPADNPLIIHIAKPADAAKYAFTDDVYERLSECFMPGPLTVVLPARENIPPETRGGLSTVAVRCPSHPVAHRFLSLCGVPVAAPSANLSGSPSPTDAPHVIDDMMGRVDMIIDGGDSDFGLESTIVKVEENGSLTLLRPGKITPEDLRTVAPVHIANAVTGELRPGEVALSPGMKYRHYAPRAPLFLLDGTPEACVRYIAAQPGRVSALVYRGDLPLFARELCGVRLFDFGEAADEQAQAHTLFRILRDADKENFDAIYAPLPRKEGIGLALYNRMIRAAAHHIIVLQ